MTWLGVFTRAVVGPAWHRAMGVWVGTAIGGGLVFGPTGMHPSDLTGLALHVPGVAAVLGVTWLLLYAPIARVLVRADGARYLRALPGPRVAPVILVGAALIALQLPWLALWLAGEGARGGAIVVGVTLIVVAIAAWRPRWRATRWPRWRGGAAALRGAYARALARRAGDAIVRGVGLAILAGLVAGLVVRNNAAAGDEVAILGGGTIAIVLLPGWVGLLLPLVDAHRELGWLAASLGVSESRRIGALASVVVALYVTGALIGAGASAVMFGASGWLFGGAACVAIGAGLLTTRALVAAEHGESPGVRVVGGAVVGSGLAVLALGWMGLPGLAGLGAVGVAGVATVRSR